MLAMCMACEYDTLGWISCPLSLCLCLYHTNRLSMAMMISRRKMMPMTAPADWRSEPLAGLILVYGFSSSIIKAAAEKTGGCSETQLTPPVPRPLEPTRPPLTLVAADALVARAAVAGPGHVIAGGVVQALAQLLAAVAERPCRTLCGSKGSFTASIKVKGLPE